MAVVRSANVISATANADVIAGPLRIEQVNIAAGAGGLTVRLRKGSVSGAILLEAVVAASTTQNLDSSLYVPAAGIYVEVVAGAGTVFLYSE